MRTLARTVLRVLVHMLIIPLIKGAALATFALVAFNMLGAGSLVGAMRQLLVADTYFEGAIIGCFAPGLFNVLRAIGNVPLDTDLEQDFGGVGLPQERMEHFNPATGLPLVNPSPGGFGGFDIHNNSYGGSQNEW